GVKVTGISDVTGFPEILDGRVKTLHPKVHAGLRAKRGRPAHEKALKDQGVTPGDVVVVNLYPFEDRVAKGVPFAEALEYVDIGGPTLLRAAAKNFQHGAVGVDPADYFAQVEAKGDCFAVSETEEVFPYRLALSFEKVQDLRYGENPHQRAAFYSDLGSTLYSVASARKVQGKEL